MTTGQAIREALTPIAVILFIAALGFMAIDLLAGCTPAPQTPKLPDYCYDAHAFEAVLVDCVRRAETPSEADVCRRAVHDSCGFREPERTAR